MMAASELETLCKNKLDTHLRFAFPLAEPVWSPGSEPPDFWLSLFGVTYAVEMTSVVDSYKVGSAFLREPSVDKTLSKFVLEIQKEAQSLGVLTGTYLVSFRQPVRDLARVRREIKRRLIDFLVDTTGVETAPDTLVWNADEDVCFASKLHADGSRLYCGWPPRGAFEEAAAIQLCTLLEAALATKAGKMAMIQEPKIVVIHDSYALASREAYTSCRYSDGITDQFAGVYISVPDTTIVAVKPLGLIS